VLYSRKNMQWATRVWWMLRAIGFDDAAVLDGGFDKWAAEGRPVEAGTTDYAPATARGPAASGAFRRQGGGEGRHRRWRHLHDQRARAGPAQRREPALRPAGPGPGSVNVPVASLVDAAGFRPPQEVAAAFAAVGAERSKRIILYCGGGIAATLDAFLLHQLGYSDLAVYDASMSEWAKDEALPMELGDPEHDRRR
jgi:thiosulfate/3-mercaptopyruvate sulfurtransferase